MAVCIHIIPEVHRISYTRFRLSSHSLAIETGRWNRRGRGTLPREEHLCPCQVVQDEVRVVTDCPISRQLRDNYNQLTMEKLRESDDLKRKCKFIHLLLALYDDRQ